MSQVQPTPKHQRLKDEFDSAVEKSQVPKLPNIFSGSDDKSPVEIKPRVVKMEKDKKKVVTYDD